MSPTLPRVPEAPRGAGEGLGAVLLLLESCFWGCGEEAGGAGWALGRDGRPCSTQISSTLFAVGVCSPHLGLPPLPM